MGKQRPPRSSRQGGCSNDTVHVCASDSCATLDKPNRPKNDLNPNLYRHPPGEEVQELVVIGAGPHGHALLLRLLEPDVDFMSDNDRHLKAEYAYRIRPRREVVQHVRKLSRGPKSTLKPPSKKSQRKKTRGAEDADVTPTPPPLTLEEVRGSVLIVDSHGGWMRGWKDNFQSLRIENLRSLMNAHTDPFDHRSLECYAEVLGRGADLVTLPLLCQRDQNFMGPYQASYATSIFNNFHDMLSRGYGIQDEVCMGTVLSIRPTPEDDKEDSDEPIFEVKIVFGGDFQVVKTIKSRRVVCAMGPMFRALETAWESSLQQELGTDYPCRRILHAHQISPFHKILDEKKIKLDMRILIVGGGITSAQLALLSAKARWCKQVTLIQRSRMVPRHFDIPNEYMGPRRGRLLEEFWSLDMHGRAEQLRRIRGGGSVPPEIVKDLMRSKAVVKEEVEISEVRWVDGRLRVTLDDGSEGDYDMIWLASGANNHIDHYSALSDLREVLPVDVVNGLPVLNGDLSWRVPDGDEEPMWKQVARKRIWCMGALSALELGPDALNLIGARHGSVRVAEAIRRDYANMRDRIGSIEEEGDCGCPHAHHRRHS